MLTAHIYLEPAPLLPMFQVPRYVTALCNRCLAKDPAERPSAREAAALLAHGAGLHVITDEPPAREQAAIERDSSVLIRAAADHHPLQAGAAALVVPQPLQPDHTPLAAIHPSPPDGDAIDRAPAEPVTARSQPADAEPGVVPFELGHEASVPPAGRRNRLVYALAAVALLAAVAATLWFLRPAHEEAIVSAPAPASGPASAPSRAGAPTFSAPNVPGLRPTGMISPAAVDPAPGPTAPGNPAATATAPATVDPQPTVTTTDPATEPSVRRLSSEAGSVQATCPAPDTAQILSWSATKPYKVTQGDSQAGPSPTVSFKHGNTLVIMTVTCNDGVPSATST
jgi:serine/threonine-protein kinase